MGIHRPHRSDRDFARVCVRLLVFEGLAAVQDGEEFGYINKSGRLVIDAHFLLAGEFHDHRAVVLQEPGVFYYVSSNGGRAFPGNFIGATSSSRVSRT